MTKRSAKKGTDKGKVVAKTMAGATAGRKEASPAGTAAKARDRRSGALTVMQGGAAATAGGTAPSAMPARASAIDPTVGQRLRSPGDLGLGSPVAKAPTSATRPSMTSATEPETRDGRLPPVGTKLLKCDRLGRVRCECEVTARGFVYRGTTYRSLSAAASAAAKDLGISTRVNGFVFFNLAKPSRGAKDPADALTVLGERFAARASLLLRCASSAESGARVRRAIETHAKAVDGVLKAAAAG